MSGSIQLADCLERPEIRKKRVYYTYLVSIKKFFSKIKWLPFTEGLTKFLRDSLCVNLYFDDDFDDNFDELEFLDKIISSLIDFSLLIGADGLQPIV